MLPSTIPQRELEAEVALHVVKELERQKEEGALLRLPLVRETGNPPYKAILCDVDTLTTAITAPMRQPPNEATQDDTTAPSSNTEATPGGY